MKHANISIFIPHAGCPNQCSFCNQKTISGSVNAPTPEEVTRILDKALLDGNEPQNTEIAFFGGSFTAIERGYMISLLESAQPFLRNGAFGGIRISTRPDAIDTEILNILKKYGVTAIELGAQSTDDEVLSINKRGHTREDIIKSSHLIKDYNFSLGLQMMTGLYGDTPEKSLKTCEDIISLKPDTVRIYPTIVLENTTLGELLRAGVYKPQSLDEAAQLCAILLKRFYDNDIRVIRLGLHSGGNVEEGYIAGPYHPAFGEICESLIYRNILEDKLCEYSTQNTGGDCATAKKIMVFVNEHEISKMIGQKGSNKAEFSKKGFDITVKGSKKLKKYEILID